MSSPAKKRKRNDYKASDQPVRGLDYFFAKQKEKRQEQTANGEASKLKVPEEEGHRELTDEELARKLQAEWDAEDQRPQAIPDKSLNETQANEESHVHRTEEANRSSKGEESNGGDVVPQEAVVDKPKNTLALQSTAIGEDIITANIPFDESPLTFDPSRYIADLQKHWATDGGHASYALLTRCFLLVNSTQSRIKIIDTLVNLLRTLIEADPDSLLPAVRLLCLVS